MKKLERRARLCLILAGLLLAGLGLFLVRFGFSGSRWASSPFNRHLYNRDGALISGTVLDPERDRSVLCGRQRRPPLRRRQDPAEGHPPRRGRPPGEHRHRGSHRLRPKAHGILPAVWGL